MRLKTNLQHTLILLVLAVFITTGTLPVYGGNPIPGASRYQLYLPLLEGKRVGLLSNHTGIVDGQHTLDILRAKGINVTVLFSPEHGFRGTADAGEKVNSSVDNSTGLPIVSLYGKDALIKAHKAMNGVDVVVTDLQDVGTRFYTYYITMMQLMDIAARQNKEFVVFDRPNPNGMYVDGPILQRQLYSGVGRLPIPVVHGMTLGELARMIIGERWLGENVPELKLTVVPCLNYTHQTRVNLLVPPSPNLRDSMAIALYPSLCYFEGTPISVGRGTAKPFTIYGHPSFAKSKGMDYQFKPKAMLGAKNPPLKDMLCYGENLDKLPIDSIYSHGVDLTYVIRAYHAWKNSGSQQPFFRKLFDNLIGDPSVRQRIETGDSAEEIKASWQPAVEEFRKKRTPYLIYP